MKESEPRIALFSVTCATHGEIAGNIGMEDIQGIVEAHRDLRLCTAQIKVQYSTTLTNAISPSFD